MEDRGDGERASPRHVTVVGVVGRRPRGAVSLWPSYAGNAGVNRIERRWGGKFDSQHRRKDAADLHLHNCFMPIKNARSRPVGLFSSFAGRQYLMPVSVTFPDRQTCQPFSAWLTFWASWCIFQPSNHRRSTRNTKAVTLLFLLNEYSALVEFQVNLEESPHR